MKMTNWLVMASLLLTGPAMAAPFYGGLFDLYEKNRREQVPNYITEDLLLLSYGLLEAQATQNLEQEQIMPRTQAMIQKLDQALKVALNQNQPEDQDEVSQANRDYLAVLMALGSDTAFPLSQRAQAEHQLIQQAKGISRSPLWGYDLDYSQFKPRGRYTQSPQLQAYFRSLRYANTVLFAVTPSRATGVTAEMAQRMAAQAAQLQQLLQTDAELDQARQALLQLMEQRFGRNEDLSDQDLRQVVQQNPDDLALALLQRARQQQRQPRILGGLIDLAKLEPELSPADALTGWRLLPASFSAESAAFQQLVAPYSGVWTGQQSDLANPDYARPFGLGSLGGQPVKAYPSSLELLALLGSQEASQRLHQQQEDQFSDYAQAFAQAKTLLQSGQGLGQQRLGQQRLDFIAASANPEPGKDALERTQALRALWTQSRHSEQLYLKQSYTPTFKAMVLSKPRAGTRLEPSAQLYAGLGQMAESWAQSWAKQGMQGWSEFAKLLQRLVELSEKQASGVLDEEEEAFLNQLDKQLLALTGCRVPADHDMGGAAFQLPVALL
ncbi:DUF3160 domain-containing protein [Magnetovirga frankeli]|uniref:DUF3160 domain-containing protein n=1 Tax=Magnetovirga frankeli TaxID=947516 RepID=UPI001292E6F8|nr:DUF3160 domain-containing protein [gamma proteobacterium SS-5]